MSGEVEEKLKVDGGERNFGSMMGKIWSSFERREKDDIYNDIQHKSRNTSEDA